MTATATVTATTAVTEDPEKVLRKLRKVLKEIAEIEEKGPVNDEQRAKVSRKSALELEVAQLVARMAPT